MMSVQRKSEEGRGAEGRRLVIELLALDLETCERCTRTSANLDEALGSVAAVLREADVDVEVRKTVVRSAAEAERLRFASSPTIRVEGRDIALEFRENNCGDCGDICGCDGSVDCRVWVWRGKEHLAAPRAMIVDAVLRAYGRVGEGAAAAAAAAPTGGEPFTLPENLRVFFGGVEGKMGAGLADGGACCDDEEKSSCCEPAAKAACCGTGAPTGASGRGGGGCGCG